MIPIYLDNNATTALHPEVWEAMRPYLLVTPGNAASTHRFGRHARQAVEEARELVAKLLDASPEEVLFTSGATEANNLAILGAIPPTPGSILTSNIEHPCVLEPIRMLVERGYTRQDIPVSVDGIATIQNLPIPDDARMVAVMLANHETGAVQPVEMVARQIPRGVVFHCDAAAAAGKMPISFRQLGVSTLTISAHKFHGPQGIGALLVRKGVKLRPLQFGGHQQQSRRPGTEPTALAVGLATALNLAMRSLEGNRAKLLSLRDRFLAMIRSGGAPVVLNGPEVGGLPHAINLSFPGCAADILLMRLDLAGVACSTGSACSSGSLLPSPVIAAMGKPDIELRSALRFSLDATLSVAEVDEAARRIVDCAGKLRRHAIE
ncbi:MAG: cysteine desulfurase [Gemmataceae bacterium]|nr:cysteine desulfurase [Gemmataceae bacterium]